MEPNQKARLRELLFRVSVVLKGLDALLELVGEVVLWIVSPGSIAQLVQFLTQSEISEPCRELSSPCRRPIFGFQRALYSDLFACSRCREGIRGSSTASKQTLGLSSRNRCFRRFHRVPDLPIHLDG